MRIDVVHLLARAALSFLVALSGISCALLVSFDEYDTGARGAPERPRFKITATVDGLDDGVLATLTVNGERGGAVPDHVALEFAPGLIDGTKLAVHADALGHVCVDATDEVKGADVSVVVHCKSEDATLTGLSVTRGSIAATLSPLFVPGNTDYRATVPMLALPGATGVSIIATTRSRSATLTIAALSARSGHAVVAPFEGSPSRVEVKVTAAAGGETLHKLDIVAGSTYLKASNGRPGLQFGSSVALSGDTLVVGAAFENSNAAGVNGDQTNTSADGAGAVYVFRRKDGAWSQEAYIKASNARASSWFGSSVALSGDTLAVAALVESSNANGVNGDQTNSSAYGAGAVYVFTRTAGSWSQQAYLKASNARADSWFGASLALSDDTLAVGAYLESSNATGVNGDQTNGSAYGAGAVYVFKRTAGSWSQQAYLKASNTRPFAAFSASLSLSGDTLAVGARGENSNATGVGGDQTNTSLQGAGAVYVFTRSSGVWSQQAYVKASNTGAASAFGAAVALAGDILAVGAPGETSNATGVNGDQTNRTASDAGAVYMFARSAAAWSQQAYLKASNTRATARFGTSVALAGDLLLVGAPGESSKATGVEGDQADTSEIGAGAAYLLGRTQGTWKQHVYIKASNARGNSRFGQSVALSADAVLVAADQENSAATGVNGNQDNRTAPAAGSAYLY